MKQLLTYFGLSYLISWIIWLPLYGTMLGIHNLPIIPFNHAIGGLGPLLASILTTRIFLKKGGLKKLLSSCFQIKPLLYLAIALVSPFILALFAVILSYFLHKTPINLSGLLTTKEFPQFNLLTFSFTILFSLDLVKKLAGVVSHYHDFNIN